MSIFSEQFGKTYYLNTMCIQKDLLTAILLIGFVGAFLAMVAFLKFGYTLFPSFPIFVIPNTFPINTLPFSKGKKIGYQRRAYL